MKAFLDSQASLPNVDPTKLKSATSAQVIGMFSHHRDVKVALEELHEAGFPDSLITLVTSNRRYKAWFSELNIKNHSDWQLFESNHGVQNFFQRLFNRGKYLLLVKGDEVELNSVGSIMFRRHGHGEIWHNHKI